MLFNSLHFVAFFIVVTTLFFALPHKHRWWLLLISSFYFYMAFLPIYVLILLITIVVDYFAGIYIAKSTGRRRKFFLILSLIANIGFLCFFKYYDFLIGTINDITSWHLPYMKELWLSSKIISWNNTFNQFLNNVFHTDLMILENIILPIGLSFHTFQAMSYTIEVYRGHQHPEKNFGIYALYVMFYPQLVAGPIERPQNMIHQFYEKHQFEYNRVVSGLRLILWGMVKKVMIADRLAIYVGAVYGNVQHHSAKSLVVATFFAAFQVYCDFSGYSDIAIGSGRVMGFTLMENFKRPYFSKSFREFWQRWHISLTTWFRDYLFFPLGGTRKGALNTARNTIIVFGTSGLWHGANWTYVIWGLMQGVILVLERLIKPITAPILHLFKERTATFISITATFCLFCLTNCMFLTPTIHDAMDLYHAIFTWKPGGLYKGEPATTIQYCFFVAVFLIVVEFFQEFYPNIKVFNHPNVVVRYAAYVSLITLLLMIGVFNGGQFVYFQF